MRVKIHPLGLAERIRRGGEGWRKNLKTSTIDPPPELPPLPSERGDSILHCLEVYVHPNTGSCTEQCPAISLGSLPPRQQREKQRTAVLSSLEEKESPQWKLPERDRTQRTLSSKPCCALVACFLRSS